ncbi:hypothetical protein I79_002889 [Cricetulus griseus]|uniref:Uncharacterized protein n=1 Tax=Cricetulus griseus TaxID=10029 RepID=G3GYK9_CRIGR|nr:hypothetical protein I79_002889 [Cricetulus griseus]
MKQVPPPSIRWLLIALPVNSTLVREMLQKLLRSALMRKLQLGKEAIFLAVLNFHQNKLGNGQWPNFTLK